MSDNKGGIFHNLTQGFHYSGSEMLKNKGEFFIDMALMVIWRGPGSKSECADLGGFEVRVT